MTSYTDLLLIAASSHKDGDNWVYNNFMQLQYSSTPPVTNNFFTWSLLYSESCLTNFLHYNKIPIKLISKMKIFDFIKSAIKLEYYLYITIDTYYINAYINSNKEHAMHGMIVYGIDDNKLYISDYFEYKKSEIGYCTYDEFQKAYKSANAFNKSADIQMYRVNQNGYSFNKDLLVMFIDDYLEDHNTNERITFTKEYNKEFSYGIKTYDTIMKDINNDLTKFGRSIYMGICLHIAHKEIMIDRIRYLKKNKYISKTNNLCEAYNELKKDLQLMKALLLRNNYQNRETEKEKSNYIFKLKIIKEKDINFTMKLRSLL
jgi:hypothetical protein